MAVGAPSNVAISNNSTSDSLAYSFDASSDDSISVSGDKYDMRYSTSADMSAASLNEGYINAGGSANYSGTISGLSSGTTYYVQFRYTGTSGPSAWADQDRAGNAEDYAATDVGVPDAPGTPTVSAKTSTSITFTWSAVNGATGYKIYSGTGTGDPSGNEIDLGNVTTKQYTGLSVATTYSVRLKAYSSAGDSGFSGTQTTDTLTEAGGQPTLSNVTPTSQTVSWSNPAGTVTAFLVADTSTNPTTGDVETSGADLETYNHTSLTPGTTYYYRTVTKTTNHNGFFSDYSSQGSGATISVPLPTSIAYTGLSTTDVRFSFVEPTFGTRVYIYDADGQQYHDGVNNYLTVNQSGTTTFDADDWYHPGTYGDMNSGATQNTVLSVGAIKFKTYYDGSYSGFSSTITGYTLPGPPTSVSATATSYDTIVLSWTNPAGSALSETFTIQRKEGSGGTYADIASSQTGTSYSDSDNLSMETEYYYQIKTVTTAGSSAYASEVNATTQAGPDVVAGDALGLGALGYATGVNGNATSETSLSACNGGATTEASFRDFYIGSVGSITGTGNFYGQGSTNTFTINFNNKGSLFDSRIGSVPGNFTWGSSQASIATVESLADRTCVITAGTGEGTAVITMTFTGRYNTHSSIPSTAVTKNAIVTQGPQP